jgi:hypothetical protein
LFVPGASLPYTQVPTLQVSPLFGLLAPGDIITHINNCPLGDRKGQISPSLVMWRVCPGEVIQLQYRKKSDGYVTCNEISVCTKAYEQYLDFPFYSGRNPQTLQSLLPTLI